MTVPLASPYMVQNLGDLEFDLSTSLKVKFNGASGLPIYYFLLVSNCNCMFNLHRLGATRKIFSYLLSLGPNFDFDAILGWALIWTTVNIRKQILVYLTRNNLHKPLQLMDAAHLNCDQEFRDIE